jgi:hypothetical protein
VIVGAEAHGLQLRDVAFIDGFVILVANIAFLVFNPAAKADLQAPELL